VVASAALNDLHLALHVVPGAAYLYALLLFPDGTLVPRCADWLDGAMVLVAVSSTLIFHTDVLFFVAYFGFLIPIVGLTSLAARLRSTTDARARQQIGVVAWALALVLLTTSVLLLLVFGPAVVGRPAVVVASLASSLVLLLSAQSGLAHAADPANCGTLQSADRGWSVSACMATMYRTFRILPTSSAARCV
jgi:hypothetical protein